MEKKDKEELDRILNQLESQYKVYRAEITSYNQIAAGSASLLVLLLVGELTVAQTHQVMYMLVPLSVISYAAVLGNLATYGRMAGTYTALLERKINELVNISSLYQYEHDYVGPYMGSRPIDSKEPGKRNFEGFIFLFSFVILPGVMPIILSIYALIELMHCYTKTAWSLIFSFLIAFIIIICSVVRILKTRQGWNNDLMEEWEKVVKKFKPVKPNAPPHQ